MVEPNFLPDVLHMLTPALGDDLGGDLDDNIGLGNMYSSLDVSGVGHIDMRIIQCGQVTQGEEGAVKLPPDLSGVP